MSDAATAAAASPLGHFNDDNDRPPSAEEDAFLESFFEFQARVFHTTTRVQLDVFFREVCAHLTHRSLGVRHLAESGKDVMQRRWTLSAERQARDRTQDATDYPGQNRSSRRQAFRHVRPLTLLTLHHVEVKKTALHTLQQLSFFWDRSRFFSFSSFLTSVVVVGGGVA